MADDVKKLYRSSTNKMLFGVCAGIGEYLKVDPTMIRLITVLAAVFSFGFIILVYIIAAVIMPEKA